MYVVEKIFTGSSEPWLSWKSLELQRKSHQFRAPRVCKVQPGSTYLWSPAFWSSKPGTFSKYTVTSVQLFSAKIRGLWTEGLARMLVLNGYKAGSCPGCIPSSVSQPFRDNQSLELKSPVPEYLCCLFMTHLDGPKHVPRTVSSMTSPCNRRGWSEHDWMRDY